jgi:hypothetical protein
MPHPRLLLCCVLLALSPLSCGPSREPEPGSEQGHSNDFAPLTITVSGQAALFPEAALLLQSQGLPLPSLDGLLLTLEEPLRVVVDDPDAVLGHATLSAEGAFSAPGIPVRDIHQSLAAGLAHPGFVRCSTLLFDTALTGSRPRTDLLDTRAWALPSSFHDALTRALGDATLRALTDGRARTLLEAGFLLGRVVDASGQPVAGARVAPEPAELAGRVYYPAPDFHSASQAGTSPSGLFVYVHSGAGAESFRLSLPDAPLYLPRHASVAPGMGLVLTLFPGSLPP